MSMAEVATLNDDYLVQLLWDIKGYYDFMKIDAQKNKELFTDNASEFRKPGGAFEEWRAELDQYNEEKAAREAEVVSGVVVRRRRR